MPMPSPGPCQPWTTDDQVAACCGIDPPPPTFATQIQIASELLWELSGRQFAGLCVQTTRPVADPQAGCPAFSRWDPWPYDGPPLQGCVALERIKLAGYPVRSIVQVQIDGTIIPPSEYRIDEWRWLVRLSKEVPPGSGNWVNEGWPSCQYLDRQPPQDGTFEVTYEYGQDPPTIGQLAAAELACQLYRACAGGDCVLPESVQRVVRQGVTYERMLYEGLWGSGRTGIASVDQFLGAYNPHRHRRRPAVWSPDVRGFPMRTDT